MSALSKVLAVRADTPIALPDPVSSQMHAGSSDPEPLNVADPVRVLRKIHDIAKQHRRDEGSISIAYGKLEGDAISKARTVQDATDKSPGTRLQKVATRKARIEVQHVPKEKEYSLDYDKNLFAQTVLLAVNAQVKSEFQNLAKKEDAGGDDPTKNQPKLSYQDKQKTLRIQTKYLKLMNSFEKQFPHDGASFPVDKVLAFTDSLEKEGILAEAAPSSAGATQTGTKASGDEKSPSAEQEALTPGLSDASPSTENPRQGSPTSSRDSQASSPEKRLSSHRQAPPPPASPSGSPQSKGEERIGKLGIKLPTGPPPEKPGRSGKPGSLPSPSTPASSSPASPGRQAPLPPAKPSRSRNPESLPSPSTSASSPSASPGRQAPPPPAGSPQSKGEERIGKLGIKLPPGPPPPKASRTYAEGGKPGSLPSSGPSVEAGTESSVQVAALDEPPVKPPRTYAEGGKPGSLPSPGPSVEAGTESSVQVAALDEPPPLPERSLSLHPRNLTSETPETSSTNSSSPSPSVGAETTESAQVAASKESPLESPGLGEEDGEPEWGDFVGAESPPEQLFSSKATAKLTDIRAAQTDGSRDSPLSVRRPSPKPRNLSPRGTPSGSPRSSEASPIAPSPSLSGVKPVPAPRSPSRKEAPVQRSHRAAPPPPVSPRGSPGAEGRDRTKPPAEPTGTKPALRPKPAASLPRRKAAPPPPVSQRGSPGAEGRNRRESPVQATETRKKSPVAKSRPGKLPSPEKRQTPLSTQKPEGKTSS